jgi:hypothetical protein
MVNWTDTKVHSCDVVSHPHHLVGCNLPDHGRKNHEQIYFQLSDYNIQYVLVLASQLVARNPFVWRPSSKPASP